jgi:VanZ family protein
MSWQWFWPASVAATLFFASSRSNVAEPHVANGDKVVHFAVYGLFATLLCRLGRGWRAAILAVLVASAFGATDEWHQSFVPGRDSDVMDWLADTAGALAAVTVYTAWAAYRRRLEGEVPIPIPIHVEKPGEKPPAQPR